MSKRDLVLVIEDETEVRNLLVDVVSHLGFDAYACTNGRAALDLIADKEISPALVICDMQMPEMTGIEFIQYQLAKNLNLNVCMLTGDASQNLAIQALQLGVTDYICKPVHFNDLCDRISRLVAFGRMASRVQAQESQNPEWAQAQREANLFKLVNSTKKPA